MRRSVLLDVHSDMLVAELMCVCVWVFTRLVPCFCYLGLAITFRLLSQCLVFTPPRGARLLLHSLSTDYMEHITHARRERAEVKRQENTQQKRRGGCVCP